ncbi:MAG TPA: aspartyl protease [Oscillatoriaceae cyanobacterium M33_DOE_052]|uniref:Aspartyl protease n=1 Tax=Planktothricoides sp. SpSt-374 TaxID=2282167 RepID=A0A7C3VRQ0_9CYAN|nr:aspartyl protease [Oscillatoriaceae cyanobacterium M33_DOE_052]
MITGEFNQKGELEFNITVIAADDTLFPVRAILDTGFNDWLLINNEDAQDLGWVQQRKPRTVQTAGGIRVFNLYEGIVLIDGEELIVRVLAGDEIKEILLGLRWLRFKRLVADFAAGVLTLG